MLLRDPRPFNGVANVIWYLFRKISYVGIPQSAPHIFRFCHALVWYFELKNKTSPKGIHRRGLGIPQIIKLKDEQISIDVSELKLHKQLQLLFWPGFLLPVDDAECVNSGDTLENLLFVDYAECAVSGYTL